MLFNCPFIRRGCIFILVIVAMGGMVFAADQKLNPNPCNLNPDDVAGLSRDLGTDVEAARAYTGTVARILKAEKFQELDCLADYARSSKERFPGGMWKLHTLYAGLYEPVQYPQHPTQEDWTNLLQRLQRWQAARPESITARVALAWAYVGYAADARGDGYANTVSESGWKLFGDRIAQAKRILDEASALPTKCPAWYVVMLLVARNQGWDVTKQRALFDEAMNLEPGYYYYARVLASSLLPKQSGDPGDTEKFTQEIADQIGRDQGDALYFQVASADYVICGCEDNPHLSLQRIERGFEASEKLYGVSMLNLNRMAYLASHFGGGDAILADKTLTRIGEQWDPQTWGDKQEFQAVKQSAAYAAPATVKLRALEAAAEANLQTPEGLRYQASFEKTYRGFVQDCVRTDGASVQTWQGKFEVLISIGAKGTVEENRVYSIGPVVACLYQKLHMLQQEQAAPFPPPPHAPYWVRLDLDWADFAPVAAK